MNELQNKTIDEFVQEACLGIAIPASQVRQKLLSTMDEQDILNRELTIFQLRGFIKLWIKTGMRHVSGKEMPHKSNTAAMAALNAIKENLHGRR